MKSSVFSGHTMDRNTYQRVKSQEKEMVLKIIHEIVNDHNPLLRYKDIEPVTEIKSMFIDRARLSGEKDAFRVESESGALSISYEMLSSDVSALGTFIVLNGLSGKNIAILGGNSYEWVVAYLAIICAASVAVPLDKEWELHQFKRYTNDTDCDCIIYSNEFEDVVWNLYNDGVTPLQTYICMKNKRYDSPFLAMEGIMDIGRQSIALGYNDFFDIQITRNDLAVIQFTTETCGQHRPVTLTHGNIAALLMSLTSVVHIDESDVFVFTLPMSDTLDNLVGLLVPLYKGSSIALIDKYKSIAGLLRESNATILLTCWEEQGFDGECHLLTAIVYGSDEEQPRALHNLKKREVVVGKIHVLPECSSIAAFNIRGGGARDSVGRALPGTKYRIAKANSQTGIGEICYKGPLVVGGYYDKIDYATPTYFFDLEDGWYCTGQKGRIDEKGYIYLVE